VTCTQLHEAWSVEPSCDWSLLQPRRSCDLQLSWHLLSAAGNTCLSVQSLVHVITFRCHFLVAHSAYPIVTGVYVGVDMPHAVMLMDQRSCYYSATLVIVYVPRSDLLAPCDGTQLLTRITIIQLTKSTPLPPPTNLHVYTGEILVLQENLFLYRVQKGVCELVYSAVLHCTCQNMKCHPPYCKKASISFNWLKKNHHSNQLPYYIEVRWPSDVPTCNISWRCHICSPELIQSSVTVRISSEHCVFSLW